MGERIAKKKYYQESRIRYMAEAANKNVRNFLFSIREVFTNFDIGATTFLH